jgi:probable biosynthetic protein (TIGR04099 family)
MRRDHSSALPATPVPKRTDSQSPLCLSPTVVVGMPHLAFGGLSENWLWKECGHRHWLMLASELGLPNPDFRDGHGRRLYAAFTAIRLSNAKLSGVQENDELTFSGIIKRVSFTQYLSVQTVLSRDQPVAKIAMVSIFVRRRVNGSNRHVERASANAVITPPITRLNEADETDIISVTQQLRSNQWNEHFGFSSLATADLAHVNFRPCPQNDFNGADFLYFASFQSITDRAQWSLGPGPEAQTPATHREIYYYGNIDVGEQVQVVLRGLQVNEGIRHWHRIFREDDKKLIADVFTAKKVSTRE